MPRLSKNERNQAFGILMVRATKQHVATAFCCNVSTVMRLAQEEHATGRVRDRRQPRQPSVTTIRRDQQVQPPSKRDGHSNIETG